MLRGANQGQRNPESLILFVSGPMENMKTAVRSLTSIVALIALVAVCIGGVAGTALADHSLADGGVTRVSAFDVRVASNGSLAVNTPVISGVSVSNVGATTATITWNTDVPATSQVDYGLTMGYGSTANTPGLATSHSVDLAGLTPQTTYHYKAVSTESLDGTTESGDYIFTTADATGPVISDVAAGNITATTTTITWNTDLLATSQVDYGQTTDYGDSASTAGLATSHRVDLIGLTPDTTYHYKAVSTGFLDGTTESADYTFTTAVDDTGPVISNVAASNVTTTTATITWTTDELATSLVEYDTNPSYGSTASVPGLVTDHSVDLTGLNPQTTYHYRVNSTDASDNPSQLGGFTFTTLDATGPVISKVAATNITVNSATITWTTDEGATSQVEYGPTSGYGWSTPLAGSLVTSHSVDLTGLNPQTTYYYRVNSRDASNNPSQLGGFTFATLDVVGPVFYDIKVTDLTATSVTIVWSTSENATSHVDYGLSNLYGSTSTLDPALVLSHSVPLTGLSPQTEYYFKVKSTDASGNPAVSGDYIFTTADPNAPAISNVTAINITGVSVTITWITDDPAESQVEYGESASYGSTAPPDTTFVQSHRVNLTGLRSQTTYHYKVKSRDASGLWAESGDFTFTTADTNAPAISGVVATDISASTASIIWTSNEAATSLVEYGTTASYGSTTSHDTSLVATHRVRLTGLKSRTTYHYRVKSRDAAGFWAESGDAIFTTTDINAPVISKVAATSITGTDATITWTTDDAAESQVEYGTSAGYGLTTTLDTNRVTKHSVYLTGLTPQVTYHYKVKSRDASGLWADSADYTFTTGTDPGGIPPVIILVRAFDFTGSGATVAWETNREATSQVEYGLTTDYGKTTTLDVSLQRYHSVDLRGLKANRTYHYRVISTDAFGNQAQSEDQTFDTTIGEAPSLSLPTWAWAIIGATMALVVGAMVVREF